MFIGEFIYLFIDDQNNDNINQLTAEIHAINEKQCLQDMDLNAIDSIYSINQLLLIVENLNMEKVYTLTSQQIMQQSEHITSKLDVRTLIKVFSFLSPLDIRKIMTSSKVFYIAAIESRSYYILSDILDGYGNPYDNKIIPIIIPSGGTIQIHNFAHFLYSHLIYPIDTFKLYNPLITKYGGFYEFLGQLQRNEHASHNTDLIIISQRLPYLFKKIIQLKDNLIPSILAIQISPELKFFFKNLIVMSQLDMSHNNASAFNLKVVLQLLTETQGQEGMTLLDFIAYILHREYNTSYFEKVNKMKELLHSIIDTKEKYTMYKSQIQQMFELGEELLSLQQASIKILNMQLDNGHDEEHIKKELELQKRLTSQLSTFVQIFKEAFVMIKKDVLDVISGYIKLAQIALCGDESDFSEIIALYDIFDKLSYINPSFYSFLKDNMYSSDMVTSLREALKRKHDSSLDKFLVLKKAQCLRDLLNLIKVPLSQEVISSQLFQSTLEAIEADTIANHGQRIRVSRIFTWLHNSNSKAIEVDAVMLAINQLLIYDNY
jgi:hypothetical protein